MQIYKPREQIHVALVYKNFAGPNISHIGLGVSGLNNCKVLNAHGIKTSIIPISLPSELMRNDFYNFTHVILAAPWIDVIDLNRAIQKFSTTEYIANCHSNVGFLQADPNGVRHLAEYIYLEQASINFRVSGNSTKFVQWVKDAYGATCSYLPNMYYLDYSTVKPRHTYTLGSILNIGAFGALRPQKNILSAAGAAKVIARQLKAMTKFNVSIGRDESTGVLKAVKALLERDPYVTLNEIDWTSWPEFRDIVGSMHLLYQCSYTESFNMVTADGIAEGVPSVVSEAIDWVPNVWRVNPDNVSEMASVGRGLLFDPLAASQGLDSLETHNSESYRSWVETLMISNPEPYKSVIAR